MVTIENLTEKFMKLQEKNQKLREERIRLDSEVKALESDYQKKLAELLEVTQTSSYEEAVAFCKEKKEELDKETERLDAELNKYLNPQTGVDMNVSP